MRPFTEPKQKKRNKKKLKRNEKTEPKAISSVTILDVKKPNQIEQNKYKLISFLIISVGYNL